MIIEAGASHMAFTAHGPKFGNISQIDSVLSTIKHHPPNIMTTDSPQGDKVQVQIPIKWTLVEPKRISIAISNFRPNCKHTKLRTSTNSLLLSAKKNCLDICIGDVIIIVEKFSNQWYRGYIENNPSKLGIFPANFVKVFGHHQNDCNENRSQSECLTSYFYTLLDPLFLQVVRTLREWHQHIISFYRNNVNIEKYQSIRKLMFEIMKHCSILRRELVPTLWRRRCTQILKNSYDNSGTVDPFARLYLDEDENVNMCDSSNIASDNRAGMEPTLEELYNRILSKLILGNQMLNLDIMPSFTYGTFSNDNAINNSQLIRCHSYLSRQYWTQSWSIKRQDKFRPYYGWENSKYITIILDYYNRLNSKLLLKSNVVPSQNQRGSFHSQSSGANQSCLNNLLPSSHNQKMSIEKCRRHLLFCIKDANFSSLFSNYSDSEQCSMLQIDVHLVRCSNVSSEPVTYQAITEKYCYRIRASGQQLVSNNKPGLWANFNRALFLDVLSKKRNITNGNSSTATNSSNHFSSQQSDSSNYYLVIQVWRYGKMLLNESRTKNMLSATMSSASASLSSGTSVFHTMSSSSLSSSQTSSSVTTSSSSLSSFVSNSNLFSSEKSCNSSSTPDSSSIDSSEFGTGGSFKRSVGFSVIPLLELVSRDQELKPSSSMFKDESVVTRVLLSDEPMLLAVSIKLYEGDLTTSALEAVLKHRQSSSISINTLPFSSSTSSSSNSSSSSLISKLSPLNGNYQLTVCAKFISEQMTTNHNPLSTKLTTRFPLGVKNMSETKGPNLQANNSLADWLLLQHGSTNMGTLTNHSKNGEQSSLTMSSSCLPFVVVQKRIYGDLITAGYLRNDFYVVLESAEFDKGGKAIPKNVEVSVCLITENGIQERALSSGANDIPVTFYRSHIQYHQNSPKWCEHLKINIPLELFESAHLRFTFCHCSSKERERKFIGFSFLPLSDHNGACLPDGEHELYIYKCDNERKLDDTSFYLNVPWGNNEKISSGHSSSTSSIASSTTSSSSTSLATTSALINSRSSKEGFYIKTNLVSSKLTQNSDILSLLKWSSTPLDKVYDALQRIGRVSGDEMVKFLEDILDALFTLFTNSAGSFESSSSQMTIIFRVLVDFFKTLNDPKFVSYRAALDTYIENQFSAPLVHQGLIACVKKYIELVIISFQSETSSPPSLSGVTKRELEFILRCLSVFDWTLKIIVQSRILYMQASASGGNEFLLESSKVLTIQSSEDFRSEIFTLFSSINRLLLVETKSSDDYLIIAIQEAVLSSLPNAFGYLSKVLSPLELAKLVKSIVHSSKSMNDLSSPPTSNSTTPTNQNVNSSSNRKTIVNARLSLLQETIRCQFVWSDEEARIELLDTFIRLLNSACHTDSNNCLSILHDIIFYLIENTFSHGKVKHLANYNAKPKFQMKHICDREIELLSFGAIDAIVEHIIELTGVVPSGLSSTFDQSTFKRTSSISNSSEGDEDYLGNYIICFMVLLDCMTVKHFEKLFETRSNRQCKELIIHIFMVFLNALYYFNDSWLEIKMNVNRIILQSLALLRTIMAQEFLLGDKFDFTIWRTYFKLSIAFLTQQRLQLDLQPYWKKQFILDTYGGDMRVMMGLELVSCWNMIGKSKMAFIPSLVSSFVDVSLVPERKLREATIPIFFDMLSVNYENNSNLKLVETALIDKLDSVAHKPECDMEYRNLFSNIMNNLIEKHKPIWYFDGIQLVKSISRLLLLLIDYRNELKCKLTALKPGSNDIDDSLLICTYALLRFYRDEGDLYNCKSLMLRYVDKLASFHTTLGNHSEAAFTLKLHIDQLSWSSNDSLKKESIYETMLRNFEQGQCWEEGIKICKVLQDVYENNYKFSKLSSILKRHAELLDKILNEHRPENEYFRVSFYGGLFPTFLQNTTFIFRGLQFEKISNFTHRIKKEFPNAQLLTKNIPTDELIINSDSQYIQIFAVKPVAEPPVSPDQTLIFGAPDNVLSYYNTNFVCKFIQDRPIQRAPFDPNNEFKSLWIERTIFFTEEQLPGILRMFQVVSTQVAYLSPIENACETIENMNNELSKLIATYSSDSSRSESISPLSMRLQGILDAAVNGGIAKYIDAFLCSEFLSSNPDQVANVTLLKNRIAHQIKILESGLTLHGRLAPIPVRPLHTRLLERFATMRNTVNQANIETSQALLWIPPMVSNMQTSTPNRPSILSQPLPPIPNVHRQDTISDPETSSLSSTSSTSATQNITSQDRGVVTPPIQVSSHSFLVQSPGGKSLKCKPLPPLPPPEEVTILKAKPIINLSNGDQSDENDKQQLSPKLEDSIYSVPQLSDLLMDCNDKVSSVDDDSLDYYDESATTAKTNGNSMKSYNNNCNIYRSRSIPRSSISNYINANSQTDPDQLPPLTRGQSNNNLSELEELKNSPPPLPPRCSNLDRSNSLNSSVRSSPIAPPALPKRRARQLSSNSNTSIPINSHSNNGIIFSSKVSESECFMNNFDGIEFENLVISSPTPRSDSTHQSSRPAPIIGIEISDSEGDLFAATPLITDTISSYIEPTNGSGLNGNQIREHRSKSSSLPRMQSLASNLESMCGKPALATKPNSTITSDRLCENNSSLIDY